MPLSGAFWHTQYEKCQTCRCTPSNYMIYKHFQGEWFCFSNYNVVTTFYGLLIMKKEKQESALKVFQSGIFSEASLPLLGLPVRWEKTQEMHSKIAFDPKKNKTYKIKENGEIVEGKKTLGFIGTTSGKSEMPGSKKPAVVRFQRFQEFVQKGHLVKDFRGEGLLPCFAHGDYVPVQVMQSDHMQPQRVKYFPGNRR